MESVECECGRPVRVGDRRVAPRGLPHALISLTCAEDICTFMQWRPEPGAPPAALTTKERAVAAASDAFALWQQAMAPRFSLSSLETALAEGRLYRPQHSALVALLHTTKPYETHMRNFAHLFCGAGKTCACPAAPWHSKQPPDSAECPC